MKLRFCVLLAAAGVLFAPASALAYCRTYTCEFDGTDVCSVDPRTGCNSGGELAHWRSGCITYAVQLDGSEVADISPDVLQGLLEDGFRAWSDGECEGGAERTPQLSAFYRGETACDQVEYNCGAKEDNANIVMFRDGASTLSNFTIALSTIIANLNTGEILDVDVEINSEDFDFFVDGADAENDAHDLRLVINHELGHFLGLSHSRAPGALMRAEYEGSNLLPAEDDIAGMCSIFPVGASDPECSGDAVLAECIGADSRCPVPVRTKSGACALPAGAQGSPFGAWALGGVLAALAAARWRRSRPAQGKSRSWQR